MKHVVKGIVCLAFAAGVSFIASAETTVRWAYDASAKTLTEIVEEGATPWVLSLTDEGVVSRVSSGTSMTLDLSDGALPDGAPTIKTTSSLASSSNKAPGSRIALAILPSTVETVNANTFSGNTQYQGIPYRPTNSATIDPGTVTFLGDKPAFTGLAFPVTPQQNDPGRYFYKLRIVCDLKEGTAWHAYASNPEYVKPWNELTADIQAKYWANFPRTTIPYGLTCQAAEGITINSWICNNWNLDDNCPFDDGLVAAIDEMKPATNVVDGKFVYVFTNTLHDIALRLGEDVTLQEYLLVGGGGAGGNQKGAGGGGGGVIHDQNPAFFSAGTEMTLAVGAGGASAGKKGDATVLSIVGSSEYKAFGGGGGAGYSQSAAYPSEGAEIASGGGAGGTAATKKVSGTDYTKGQGNPGGNAASSNTSPGGGGGYSQPGGDADGSQSGVGGEGYPCAITGTPEVYGSGGGGGGGLQNSKTSTPAQGGTNAGNGGNGTSNTEGYGGTSGRPGMGGGGGGGGAYKSVSWGPGKGGSGCVVLVLSKGGAAGQPVVEADDISITFPDGCTQPAVAVTLGGVATDIYKATVIVSCGTGALAQAGTAYECTQTFRDVANGDTVSFLTDFYPPTGEKVYVRVHVTADGATDVDVGTSKPAEGTLPPFVGRGGDPTRVIHVRDDARGKGTGRNWTDAYTNFRAALKELNETRCELWYCGSNVITTVTESGAISPSAAVTLRGGFAGIENAASERVAGVRSTLDGAGYYDSLVLNNDYPCTIDGFRLCHGISRGLDKSGAGDLVVSNCVIEANGTADGIEGRAIRVKGDASATKFRMVNCLVLRNRAGAGGLRYGNGAVWVGSLAEATVENVLFDGNGYAVFGRLPAKTLDGRIAGRGMAFYASAVPVTLRNCRFLCNGSSQTSCDDAYAGGIVYLAGACGGSRIVNCLFLGNELLNGSGTIYGDSGNATLIVNMSDAAQVVEVDNCTFAMNAYCGDSSTAGMNVVGGTANVRNTVFYGNRATVHKAQWPSGVVTADIKAMRSGIVNVSYTMFDREDTCRTTDDGILNFSNCYTNDPMFVSTQADFAEHWNAAGYYTSTAPDALRTFNCHVRGKFGYVDETTGEIVKFKGVQSPCVDAGDPASSFKYERLTTAGSCGGRVNLGFYGNTPWITASKRGFALILK